MIKEAIIKLTNNQELTAQEAYQCMNEIMTNQASDVQKTAYLVALAMKGETIDEIVGSAKGMRQNAADFKSTGDLMEIVGTGGDKSNSFNISTTASLVIASSGMKVAKHGNRAASSKCGAADVLEALKVKIDIPVTKNEKVLEQTNICFLFAPVYHQAMRYVGPIRKELGIRTIFNLLGPLTNPAHASYQLMGVYDRKLVKPMAHVLHDLGLKRFMVVYGNDNLDEISLSDATTVCEYDGNQFHEYQITPEQFGLKRCQKADLVGGNPSENASITMDVLNGVASPCLDAVLLNAGAGLYVCNQADSIQAGIDLARELIKTGKPLALLNQFVAATNS